MTDKILTLEKLVQFRNYCRVFRRKVVVTNGCFDVLHLGHVSYLRAARVLGHELVIGLNSDASVRQLKGPRRPVNPEGDRAAMLAAYDFVSAVYIFPEPRASNFLFTVRPDVYVKGGDYTLEKLDPVEREIVQGCGAEIVFLPLVAGRSTSALIEKMETAKS